LGIKYLDSKYTSMRRIRGDGNCFYRAFLFSYLEGLLNEYDIEKSSALSERDRVLKIVTDSKEELINKHSYSAIAIEDFHEVRFTYTYVI
jgi:ubiquitin thioesterase protein OTUB1